MSLRWASKRKSSLYAFGHWCGTVTDSWKLKCGGRRLTRWFCEIITLFFVVLVQEISSGRETIGKTGRQEATAAQVYCTVMFASLPCLSCVSHHFNRRITGVPVMLAQKKKKRHTRHLNLQQASSAKMHTSWVVYSGGHWLQFILSSCSSVVCCCVIIDLSSFGLDQRFAFCTRW